MSKQRKLVINQGDRFNRLKIIEEVKPIETKNHNGIRTKYYRAFNCECECGNRITVRLCSLRSGNTKSCGCRKSEVNIERNKASTGKKKSHYTKKNSAYWDGLKNKAIEEK